MAMSRRDFLKGLSLMPLAAIVKLDVNGFISDLDNFTDEQLENLKDVVDLETENHFSPYFLVPYTKMYKVTLVDGYTRNYNNARDIRDKYGNIFSHYDVQDDTQSLKDYTPKDGWLL